MTKTGPIVTPFNGNGILKGGEYSVTSLIGQTKSRFEESSNYLEELKLTLGRDPDITDLDEHGWLALSEQKKIISINRLGEGAGGAVTKCVLQSGSTVFALKVTIPVLWILLHKCFSSCNSYYDSKLTVPTSIGHHNKP
jgi:hypothetical protein